MAEKEAHRRKDLFQTGSREERLNRNSDQPEKETQRKSPENQAQNTACLKECFLALAVGKSGDPNEEKILAKEKDKDQNHCKDEHPGFDDGAFLGLFYSRHTHLCFADAKGIFGQAANPHTPDLNQYIRLAWDLSRKARYLQKRTKPGIQLSRYQTVYPDSFTELDALPHRENENNAPGRKSHSG
jgi:hypothetical protein